jgi:phytoene desaturase
MSKSLGGLGDLCGYRLLGMQTMRGTVVVVGAGIGGLSAAVRLATAGATVTLLEQNAAVGGKMGEARLAGAGGEFRFDTGPSVITMRHVFEDLFAAAGRRLDDYLTLLPVEPLTRYFYEDGTVLDATRDWPRMADQIAAIESRDVEGYAAYLAYAAMLHRLTGPLFIYGPRPGPTSFFRLSPLDALRLEPWLRMDAAIRRRVRSPHLRQLFGRFATYIGSSPYLAPATLGVISHVELTQGVWYPRGGIYSIAAALEGLARELGVEVRTGCRVQEIAIAKGRATGVRLEDGEVVAADAVLANVDIATLYSRLIPAGTVPDAQVQRHTEAKLSCSGFILLLGVCGEHPRLAHHNIFFSHDYPAEFAAIFDDNVPPREPTLYVAITAKSDAGDAPRGCENWFVMANAPAASPTFDWANHTREYRDLVLDRLARLGLDVRGRIIAEQAITPLDLEARTGGWRGALYGQLFDSPWVAFRRPTSRAGGVRGLYLTGGTTHPGGGVPMVMLSGKLAADAIINDA